MKIKKQKIEIQGFINAKKALWDDEVHYIFSGSNMSTYGYILLQPHTIEVDLEPYDLNALTIDNLKAQKKAVEADAYVKVQAIEDEIQKLLSIEDKS